MDSYNSAYYGSTTKDAFLPWCEGATFEPEYAAPQGSGARVGDIFIGISVIIHATTGKRERKVVVPSVLTCADLKGHLAVEGVVSSCGGLEVSCLEAGDPVTDEQNLILEEGDVLHLRQATSLVGVTALALCSTGQGTDEEEIYELVLPAEGLNGAGLREHIFVSTSGALVVESVCIADLGEGGADPNQEVLRTIGEDEPVFFQEGQVIVLRRAACEAAPVEPAQLSGGSSSLLSSLRARLPGPSWFRRGVKSVPPPPGGASVRSAANVKARGSVLSCTSKNAWAGCAVFDVAHPDFFELTVQLLADAPSAETDGLAGRWMIGVVPVSAASTQTEADRRRLLDMGYFVTVCHGHPAKLHSPSAGTRGTCGEDCAALPGELRKGQTLTIRWYATEKVLAVQVDDDDAIALPYVPSCTEELRPCVVLGGKPCEVRVVQLAVTDASQKHLGGA